MPLIQIGTKNHMEYFKVIWFFCNTIVSHNVMTHWAECVIGPPLSIAEVSILYDRATLS